MVKKKNLDISSVLTGGKTAIAVSLGMILTAGRKIINLLPSEVADTRKTKKKRKEWVKLLILFILAFTLSVGIFTVKLRKNNQYIKILKEKIEEIGPREKEVKEKMLRLDFIKDKLSGSLLVADLIYELYNLAPEEVSLSLLSLEDDGDLILQGTSREGAGINILQGNLVGSPFFDNVVLDYVKKRKIYKGELTDFKITCQVRSR